MIEYFCIYCNEKMSEKCKLNSYPREFMVFRCPECGYLNDWWALHDMGRGTLKSIIRALFLDSFLQGKEIMYDQIVLYIKERYECEKFTEKKIRDVLNSVFHELDDKKISVKRYPLNKLSSEKFYKIIVNHDNIADFFNKRIIYQWDLQHLTFDLKELKEKIKSITKKIRYKNRWLAAFDYFLVHA